MTIASGTITGPVAAGASVTIATPATASVVESAVMVVNNASQPQSGWLTVGGSRVTKGTVALGTADINLGTGGIAVAAAQAVAFVVGEAVPAGTTVTVTISYAAAASGGGGATALQIVGVVSGLRQTGFSAATLNLTQTLILPTAGHVFVVDSIAVVATAGTGGGLIVVRNGNAGGAFEWRATPKVVPSAAAANPSVQLLDNPVICDNTNFMQLFVPVASAAGTTVDINVTGRDIS